MNNQKLWTVVRNGGFRVVVCSPLGRFLSFFNFIFNKRSLTQPPKMLVLKKFIVLLVLKKFNAGL